MTGIYPPEFPIATCCRSFDQFANLVLETAVERIVVGYLYSEKPLGLYVVRGENVVLLGEIDDARDPPPPLQVTPLPLSLLPSLLSHTS